MSNEYSRAVNINVKKLKQSYFRHCLNIPVQKTVQSITTLTDQAIAVNLSFHQQKEIFFVKSKKVKKPRLYKTTSHDKNVIFLIKELKINVCSSPIVVQYTRISSYFHLSYQQNQIPYIFELFQQIQETFIVSFQ